jgi:hypothetical protein
VVGVSVGAGVSVGGMGVGVEVGASVGVGLLSKSSTGVALGGVLPIWQALNKKLKRIPVIRYFFMIVSMKISITGSSSGYHTASKSL